MDKDLVSVGMVIDLNYSNPWLSPFEEFQSYKTHPVINNILENGKRLSYGAKSITMGGLLSLPKLCFKGGILIGCDAGFLNSSRLKGIHTAIESGIIAAESIIESMLLDKNTVENNELVIYTKKIKASGLYKELNKSRNFKQWSNKYKIVALLMIVLEQKIFRGHFFWNLYSKKSDNESLKPAIFFDQIIYQKPNYKTTFDIDSSVFLSNTRYEKNEPVHLKINNSETPILINLKYYAGPEARYCPAGVYNFIKDENGNHKLHVNSENCIHCKTCDIKDITQNITWETPQGGSGPAYNGM
ncbi:electron-transferring-flavoprotein dehydrogenase [Strigomonas culicis]|nr:electron-transferring-flavoprotein dehydrogenase [Strigomonas culicis]|eukprot:EPY19334.1 electron-transferring-flavoprotein dehydrogenase [Strigomonas culicis]